MKPGDVRIEMPPQIQVNLSPYGYYRWGQDFRRAAVAVPTTDRFSIVPYFLHCQAIELGLKAFLLLRGLSKRQLRLKPYGHDLSALLNHAQSEGIGRFVTLRPAEVTAIQAANRFYDSGTAGRRLQYFDVYLAGRGFRDLPDLGVLASAASQLTECEQLEQEYLKA